jgi:hypothetical protein
MKIKHTLAALSVAALTVAGTGFAADDATNAPTDLAVASTSAPASDAWQFGVTVPLWAPQINGNVTVQGRQQDVNINFSQLREHLDASFALAVEARKGKFGMFGDVGYMKFSADGMVSGAQASSELKFLVADAGVSYLLLKTGTEHPFVLEGTLGVRYWYTSTDLSVHGPFGFTPLFSGSKTMDLVDPVIGLRGSQYLTQKLHLDFAGDIGGFGISDNQAELDWAATGAATYDFARWFSLSAGYKALGVDASNGSGFGKNGVNLTFHGVLIAAKFTF